YTIYAGGQCCPNNGTYGIYPLGPVNITASETIQYYSQPCLRYIISTILPPGDYYNDNLNYVTEGECVTLNNGLQNSIWFLSQEGYYLPIGISFSSGNIESRCYLGHL
ncbi:28079_t:CDS:1, partial [Gigaspora margarita]